MLHGYLQAVHVPKPADTQQAGCSGSGGGSSRASDTLAHGALQEQEANPRIPLAQGSPPAAAQQGQEAAEAAEAKKARILILHSWNVEGKKKLAAVEDDNSDWDALCSRWSPQDFKRHRMCLCKQRLPTGLALWSSTASSAHVFARGVQKEGSLMCR